MGGGDVAGEVGTADRREGDRAPGDQEQVRLCRRGDGLGGSGGRRTGAGEVSVENDLASRVAQRHDDVGITIGVHIGRQRMGRTPGGYFEGEAEGPATEVLEPTEGPSMGIVVATVSGVKDIEVAVAVEISGSGRTSAADFGGNDTRVGELSVAEVFVPRELVIPSCVKDIEVAVAIEVGGSRGPGILCTGGDHPLFGKLAVAAV